MTRNPTSPADPQWTLRVLIEDLACKAEDMGKTLEGLQGLADEIALDSRKGAHSESLVKLQVLDSLTQRLFILSRLFRCLKGAVPADLTLGDVERLQSFSAEMSSYQGATTCGSIEYSNGSGDCEIWKS